MGKPFVIKNQTAAERAAWRAENSIPDLKDDMEALWEMLGLINRLKEPEHRVMAHRVIRYLRHKIKEETK